MARSTGAVVCVSVLSAIAVVAACNGTNGAGGGGGADGGTTSGGTSSGDDVGSSGGADGGPTATPCKMASECASGVCNQMTGLCVDPTCSDGVANEDETDLDCGGGTCPKCDVQKKCKVAGDCATGVCADTGSGLECQPPSCTDGVKNETETDTDCGGTCSPCEDGKSCVKRQDCVSDVCAAGKCASEGAGCTDTLQDGTETDVDCGGAACSRCDDNLKCLTADDCKSSVCADVGAGLQCQPPSPTDGIKNGNETDVDCGGGAPENAPGCAAGLVCVADGDCASQGCDYTSHCAITRSCKPHYGGDTCGAGGAGGVGAQSWESCCAMAPVVPTTGPTKNQTINLGKYPVTAGRMRAFLEAVGYNVRQFVQDTRTAGTMPTIPGDATAGGPHDVLDSNWDMYLPVSFLGNTDAGEISDCNQAGTCTATNGECSPSTTCLAGTEQPGIYTSIYNHLGGLIFKDNTQTSTGCYVGSPGTHSFRFPDDHQDGAPPDQDQNTYDTKTLNCVDYLVAQAFCVWDGGRLDLVPEWQAAWGSGTMPWSATSSLIPAAPPNRCLTGVTCTTTAQCTAANGGNSGPTCQSGSCCLPTSGGADTYWGCRYPWATDANHPACGLTWDTATYTIEYADYQYTYEYPKQGSGTNPSGGDYIVFLTPPGRTSGRGPNGHSDVVGAGYEQTTTMTYNASPFAATHNWSGNGSWEVHGYAKGGGPTGRPLLDKYGKLGLRCAYP